MKLNKLLSLIVCVFIALSLSVSGVFALWHYWGASESGDGLLSTSISEFKYGTIYITKVVAIDGDYSNTSIKKVSELNIGGELTLNSKSDSFVSYAVTFYNSTDVSYYYNETQVVSWDNDKIGYTVSEIGQKDEIPAKTYKTINVTFGYNTNDVSEAMLSSTLHFNFVIDKESIGGIVAQTAVDRFRDILNNKVAPDSYETLENAMTNRSGWNKASAVTYIGNVSGSNSSDSKVIGTLFGAEFMSMDLDGDGKAEPITIMIKREDLDGNNSTGAEYTYTSWGREYTVSGAEMTIYITSENLDNVSNGQSITVYAATFTKAYGSQEWVQLIPLTKGAAEANNYDGYGGANSFNTDTWVNDEGKTIEQLALANLNDK